MSDSNEMNARPSHPKLMPPTARKTAEAGIKTTKDYVTLMSDLIADTISGRIAPEHAAIVIKAGNSMLKAAELQYRYAKEQGETSRVPQLLSA